MAAQDKTEHAALLIGQDATNEIPHSLVLDKHLAKQIEAALQTLGAYLSARQIDIVRTVLCTSIESDPVSRLLAQRFVRANGTRDNAPGHQGRAHRPEPRQSMPLARTVASKK